MKQRGLFGAGEDSPLITGTPVRGVDSPFTPAAREGEQAGFFQCPICRDTGWVKLAHGFCLCPAGQALQVRQRGEAVSKFLNWIDWKYDDNVASASEIYNLYLDSDQRETFAYWLELHRLELWGEECPNWPWQQVADQIRREAEVEIAAEYADSEDARE